MEQQLGQLQEELKKEGKEEKSRGMTELAEVSLQSKKRIESLELEVEKAKESERKMLESLVSQTKQLEQTKISLEETKLEIRSLQQNIQSLEDLATHSNRNLDRHLDTDVIRAREEVALLRNELKRAIEAEGNSKRAMDGLAVALKEVTTEASQVKSELVNARGEARHLKDLLKITDEKFRAAVEESESFKLKLEESLAAWISKENGFINCMKVSEEEISKAKGENDRLIDSLRVSREDNSKLRDILKQAVDEATDLKEALGVARKENSQLNDLLSKKENALQSINQDYDCLKVSEASALDSVRELESLLASVTLDSSRTADPWEDESFGEPGTESFRVNIVRGRKSTTEFPSDNWRSENPRIQKERRHPVEGSGRFKVSAIDTEESLELKTESFSVPKTTLNVVKGRKSTIELPSGNRGSSEKPQIHRERRRSVGGSGRFKGCKIDTEEALEPESRMLTSGRSVSNLTESRIPSSLFRDNFHSMRFDDLSHIDRNPLDGRDHEFGSPMKQTKKKPHMLRRFGDMLRRKSVHKC